MTNQALERVPPAASPPALGSEIDRWASGLTPVEAAVALTLAGVDLAAYRTAVRDHYAGGRDPAELGYLEWRLQAGWADQDPRALLEQQGNEHLFTRTPGFRSDLLVRLSFGGGALPHEAIPRLLRAPGVAAALIPVSRPPGALRRRPWRWPLRIGMLGIDCSPDELRAASVAGHSVDPLVTFHDVSIEPAAVDILLTAGQRTVARAVASTRLLANAVVVLGPPAGSWPEIEAALAMLRATTGAVAAGIAQLGQPFEPRPARGGADEADRLSADAPGQREDPFGEALPRAVTQLLYDLSHALPFDVALTRAFEGQLLLTGELDELRRLDLPEVARRHARGLRHASGYLRARPAALGEPGPGPLRPPLPEGAATHITEAAAALENIVEGLYLGESHEATVLRERVTAAEVLLDEVAEPRHLQCYVNSFDAPVVHGPPIRLTDETPNVLRPGRNALDVFVGPPEGAAVIGGQVPDADLSFDEQLMAARLTAVVVPLVPRGDPQRAEIDVPRVGRSRTHRFLLDAGDSTGAAISARLVLLHRNRVLQTAVLRGTVDGDAAELVDIIVVHADLSRLDDRRAFDLALIANHDALDTDVLIAHADGHTKLAISSKIAEEAKELRRVLLDAADIPPGANTLDERRQLLITLAVHGRELYKLLRASFERFEHCDRMQIVTADAAWFLPLELAYTRWAPNHDAQLCNRWAADNRCYGTCTAETDRAIVCPSAFFGLTKTIERYFVDDEAKLDSKLLVLGDQQPVAGDRGLRVDTSIIAASTKVTPRYVARARASLPAGSILAKTWDAWVETLKAIPTELLVLMPHTQKSEDGEVLEISRELLARGRLEVEHVTGGRDVRPVVILFGCDTAGSADDPSGWATEFLRERACVVFSTLTMLKYTHAAELTRIIVEMLRDPSRKPQFVGDFIRNFRIRSLAEGYLAGLSITAHGDLDWTV